jgi:hypothetical protein
MEILPEFFQGSISRDFQETLDADPSLEAASDHGIDYKEVQKNIRTIIEEVKRKKSEIGKLENDLGKLEEDIGKLHNQIPLVIPQTPPPRCSVGTGVACAGTAAFVPSLEGWSNPPAPPAF